MFEKAQHFFENEDLVELHRVFLRVCKAAAIEAPHRAPLREHVADLMIKLVSAGEADAAGLEQRVLQHLDCIMGIKGVAADSGVDAASVCGSAEETG